MNLLHRFRQTAIPTPAAFSEMYERNRLPVFRYIYSLMGGPADDAEDLTAETFLHAWKACLKICRRLPARGPNDDEVINHMRKILKDHKFVEDMTEHNYKLGQRFYSYTCWNTD